MPIEQLAIIPTGMDSVGATLLFAVTPIQGQQPVFTEVPLITKLTPPQVQLKSLKATAINQGDRTERYVIGMQEGGQVQFSCVYTIGLYQQLDVLGGQTLTWRVVFPDGGYLQFPGFIEKLYVGQLSASENEAVLLEGEIKVAAHNTFFFTPD